MGANPYDETDEFFTIADRKIARDIKYIIDPMTCFNGDTTNKVAVLIHEIKKAAALHGAKRVWTHTAEGLTLHDLAQIAEEVANEQVG